ncbi:phosphodiester glycosidase family protein [Dysgonomonas sp. BGC7]|uniref:phosphodiester glycosidase family protein n=1 Tax=Dysgonomonas sp. BGC7 TaxID=1658008 RepID=UPI00067F9FAC|nr:phosphodiester glycosidase family protein [Dysgonomonas sp. BGC7]MBD8390238.1 phosphodiester glycosidase family protein [Dysgonomonas sp. BGC7]
MLTHKHTLILFILLIGSFGCQKDTNDSFICYTVDTKSQNIHFYWLDDAGKNIGSIQNLKTYVESKGEKLVFATNGGMYNKEASPQGLFIDQYKIQTPLDTTSGTGNFYMLPNGVFAITSDNVPIICKTENFKEKGLIRFATQSGPMLVIDGEIHPAFKKGSQNTHIRNGVGILPDGKAIFVMSKSKVNFYDLAFFFKSLGCKDALYFDGYVSRTYLPEKDWIQTDGNFGVIIAVIEPFVTFAH